MRNPEYTARKVLVYATSPAGLLVFDQPEHPDIPLQVPGGTLELDESPLDAVRREFEEEAGLPAYPHSSFRALAVTTYVFDRCNVQHRHLRTFYHLALPTGLPESWEHHEKTPDGGSAPILFRFFWLGAAPAHDQLGFGMNEFLDLVPAWR